MLIGLLLGVATPSPPPGLPILKTIATVRATPFCSALRAHVAPALDDLIAADAFLARGAAFFGDEPEPRSSALRLSFQHLNLENGITPIVRDMAAAQAQLDGLRDEPAASALKHRLQMVLERQNDELNAITGYLGTQAMNDLRAAGPTATLRSSVPLYVALREHAEEARYPHATPYEAASAQFRKAQTERDAAERAASEIVLKSMKGCAP